MKIRVVYLALILLAWLTVPHDRIYAQEVPRDAQTPQTPEEADSDLYLSPSSQEHLPVRQAEEVAGTQVTPTGSRSSPGTGVLQSTPPIPIPDVYATTEGVTLDIPAPGLIANDYHPDGVGFILSNFFAPEHGTLPSIVTNGAFRYVPPPGFTGTDTFRYRLRDSEGIFSDFITVTIEVFPDPNRPPVPVRDEYATLEGVTLDVSAPGLIANDYDPDGDTFILSNFFTPEHGSLPSIVTNGAFRYEPPAGFTGTDTFRYRLRDSEGTFSEYDTVAVHVLPAGGDHPVPIPDHYVTMEGQTLDVPAPGLIANDIDPGGDTFILSNFFAPEHGTLPSIVTSGAFRYEPAPDFTGTDTFRYRLRNSKGNFSDFITVTVEVLPEFNRPPVPIADFYGTPENVTLDIPAPGLIANDFDPDGDSFILSNFFAPEQGTLPSIVTNGAFRYVPPPGFTGLDTFRYRLRDDKGVFSDYITVTIFVGIDPFQLPSEIILVSPDDGSSGIPLLPEFTWLPDVWADTYRLQIATDSQFSSIVKDTAGLSETFFSFDEPLDYVTDYFWRVQGVNAVGEGDWSMSRSFSTSEVPVPENLVLTEMEKGIQLSWDISSTINISGYRIYRGPAVKQVSVYDLADPDAKVFTDSMLHTGPSIYALTAVDINGAESNFSDIVSYYSITHRITGIWKLISLPVERGELQVTQPSVYHFDHAYRSDSMLISQKGYWVRSDVEETFEIRGAGLSQATLALKEGWNLIGSLVDSVEVGTISDPSEILTTAPVYGFDGSGYQEANFITPGNGYWIHAGQNGKIDLRIEPGLSVAGRQKPTLTSEGQSPSRHSQKDLLEIHFSTEKTVQIFYLSASPLSDMQKLRFLMPPKSPEPILDVRSRDGFRVDDTFPVELLASATSFPVRISIPETEGPFREKVLKLALNHGDDRETLLLIPGEEVNIYRNYESIILHEVSDEDLKEIVEKTDIHPVYPNPFNTHGTITYQLAGQEWVRLEIYDVIGRKVAVLADDEQLPGVYTRRIDASSLASGVYLLRFQAGDFYRVQKLTLIK